MYDPSSPNASIGDMVAFSVLTNQIPDSILGNDMRWIKEKMIEALLMIKMLS
jgi:hypothetical protein